MNRVVIAVIIAILCISIYAWYYSSSSKQSSSSSSTTTTTASSSDTGGASGTSPPAGGGGASAPPPPPEPEPEPPEVVGRVDLRNLVVGSKLTFKHGWWLDGAYSDGTPSERTCASMNKCPTGAITTYVLGDKITKVEYASSRTNKQIGKIKLYLANGASSGSYGASRGASDYVNNVIIEPRGIKHLWSAPDGPVLKHIAFN
uniref:Membrane protein n=1 Tax=Panulirus argus virus 1 TaxID=380624 RepID=A0A6G9HE81_9VIRU|nr:membrane protein [Panulirus argus virus 1]